MNKFSKFLVGIALVSMSGIGVVNAQMITGKHDLSANAGSLPATGGQDLCRFCHTPHNSNAVAPLWDRNPPDTVTFLLYDSPTMGNTMGQPTGVSQGCLSCHDGVTAFDSLLSNGLGTSGNDMGTLYPTSTANLGATLANDHPVGVDLLDAGEMELASTVTGAGLRLFGTGDTVECASCHDPHDNTAGWFMLRLDPGAGTLCETCHTK
jgi:predicted CXXCH cytochrome family protein